MFRIVVYILLWNHKTCLPNRRQKKKSFYTALGFLFCLLSVCLFFFLFSKVPSYIKASAQVPQIAAGLVMAVYVFSALGLMASVLAFVKKEKPTSLKIISAVGNGMNFLFLLGLLGFWLSFRM